MRFGSGWAILTENDFMMSNNKNFSKKNENINNNRMGL